MAKGIVVVAKTAARLECGIVTVTMITKRAAHLWLYVGTAQPEWKDNRKYIRRRPRIHALEYTFQAIAKYEQQESGQTFTHTWLFPWPSSSTRIYYAAIDPYVTQGKIPITPIYAADLQFEIRFYENWRNGLTGNYPWTQFSGTGAGTVVWQDGHLAVNTGGAVSYNGVSLDLSTISPGFAPTYCDFWFQVVSSQFPNGAGLMQQKASAVIDPPGPTSALAISANLKAYDGGIFNAQWEDNLLSDVESYELGSEPIIMPGAIYSHALFINPSAAVPQQNDPVTFIQLGLFYPSNSGPPYLNRTSFFGPIIGGTIPSELRVTTAEWRIRHRPDAVKQVNGVWVPYGPD